MNLSRTRNQTKPKKSSWIAGASVDYRALSLLTLARAIAEGGDRLALAELHDRRTVFRHGHGRPLLLADFVDRLRLKARSRSHSGVNVYDLAEEAYGLTVDKFCNLPGKETESRLKQKGPDCRYYFRAFLEKMEKVLDTNPELSPLDEERLAAQSLQGFVYRHFQLSWLECRRKVNPFVSRYSWQLDNGTLGLWFPIHMNGQDRRNWLTLHAGDADPSRPGERERIQALIDQNLTRESFVPYFDSWNSSPDYPPPWSVLHKVSQEGLARAVAWEKAETIQLQRPAIQALGKRTLKSLIVEIFERLTWDEYNESQLARKYGMSKASLSRFAGSQWLQGEDSISSVQVPDLWRNTAQVLSQHPVFVEAAQEAGVWKKIEMTLQAGRKLTEEDRNNG